MTVMTDRVLPGLRDLESLISPALFARLAGRVERDAEVDRPLAERIVREALVFLVACGRTPGVPLSPSRTVDEGWHAFILHTREYAEFCDRVVGHFIHHTPDEEPGGDRLEAEARVLSTVAHLRSAGLPADEELWSGRGGSCSSQCGRCCSDHPGSG